MMFIEEHKDTRIDRTHISVRSIAISQFGEKLDSVNNNIYMVSAGARAYNIIIIGIPSPTHSLNLGLNPSFSATPLPTAAFPLSRSRFTIWIYQTVYCYF